MKQAHLVLDEASASYLAELIQAGHCNKTAAIKDAIRQAREALRDRESAPMLERISRGVLGLQERFLEIEGRLRTLEDSVAAGRKLQSERFDQVIAFIRESEKHFSPLREGLSTVNQNALLGALYAMSLVEHHTRRPELEAWIRTKSGGA